jgi:hypothetical protein
MYKLAKKNAFGETTTVIQVVGNLVRSIPFDPDNTDYQAYLKWVSEGNTPEPADE